MLIDIVWTDRHSWSVWRYSPFYVWEVIFFLIFDAAFLRRCILYQLNIASFVRRSIVCWPLFTSHTYTHRFSHCRVRKGARMVSLVFAFFMLPNGSHDCVWWRNSARDRGTNFQLEGWWFEPQLCLLHLAPNTALAGVWSYRTQLSAVPIQSIYSLSGNIRKHYIVYITFLSGTDGSPIEIPTKLLR